MTRCTSSCGAATALLLLSTTTSGFVAVTNNHHNNPVRTPTSRTAALHATTENFQRSLLAAQIANNKRNASPTKSITATQSVDYDAAARLAYEASGGSTDDDDFAAFKSKYLQDTSNLVATKQRTRVAKEKAAAAKEKAQKAAEAAQLAKEKAQAKIREREDAVVAAAAAKTAADVSKESEEESSQPADETVITPTPPKVETLPPKPVVTAATTTAEESETAPTTTSTESSSTTSSTSSGTTIPRELALVPINESTVQFTAGALGLTAGLVLGGPLLAIFLSATANYLSRKDDEPQPGKGENDSATSTSPKRIVDTASQTALLIYNFLAQFERDNKIVDGTFKLIEGAVDKAKQSEEGGETIASLENTLGGVAKSVEKLNEDFDLVGGAGTVLNSVGDLVEDSVDKVIDLNDQFKLTERVGGVVKGAVAKVTEKKD